jgi:hypothetical protein
MVALYRLTETTFCRADNELAASIHLAGEVIEYSAVPGRSMIPLNSECIPPGSSPPVEFRKGDVL